MLFRSYRWQVAKVVSPLIVALLAAAIWPDFIQLAMGSGHAITFVIVAGMATGAMLIVSQSLRVNHRWEALARFIRAVEDKTVDWRSLPYTRTSLGKMLLRQETLALNQNAIEKDVQDLRVRVHQAHILPDFLVGLMVALGLVGTFIGLIYTLADVGAMLAELNTAAIDSSEIEQVFGRMVAQLQSPLTAMGTAFAASLFGLIGSILLGLMMVLLRRQVEDYLQAVRKFMLKCLDIRNRHFSQTPAAGATEEMLSRQVYHLGEMIERLGDRQSEALRLYEALQRQFEQTARRDEQNRAQLDARFEQIGEWKDAAIAQVNDTKTRLASLEGMLTALFERMDASIAATQSMTQAMTEVSARGSADLRHTVDLLAGAAETQKVHSAALEQCAQGLALAPVMLESLQAWNQAVGAHQDARLQAFEAQLQVIRVLLERKSGGTGQAALNR